MDQLSQIKVKRSVKRSYCDPNRHLLARNIEKGAELPTLIVLANFYFSIFISIFIFGRVALQQILFSNGSSINITVYLIKTKTKHKIKIL